jgi:uncharacterized protein YlaN (UPF0358 family)
MKKTMKMLFAGALIACVAVAAAAPIEQRGEQKKTEKQTRSKEQKRTKGEAKQGRITREQLAEIKAELARAVKAGRITEEQAKQRMERLTKALKAQSDRKPSDRKQTDRKQTDRKQTDRAPAQQRMRRERIAKAREELAKAVKSGRITEKQAKERMEAMVKRMKMQAGSDKPGEHQERRIVIKREGGDHNPEQMMAEIGKRIRMAVEMGEMTPEQGRKTMAEVRKQLADGGDRRMMMRRGGDQQREVRIRVERREMAGDQARGVAMRERMMKAGMEIRKAVQAGRMTPAEARAKMQAMRKGMANRMKGQGMVGARGPMRGKARGMNRGGHGQMRGKAHGMNHGGNGKMRGKAHGMNHGGHGKMHGKAHGMNHGGHGKMHGMNHGGKCEHCSAHSKKSKKSDRWMFGS